MDAAVIAAVITGGTALLGSGVGLALQARGQRISTRIALATAVTETRQESHEAVLDAWKRIVGAQERRIARLETAERTCQSELQAVRIDLKKAIHDLRP